jgi:hypothetical protein
MTVINQLCTSSSCAQACDMWRDGRISATNYTSNLCPNHYMGAWSLLTGRLKRKPSYVRIPNSEVNKFVSGNR